MTAMTQQDWREAPPICLGCGSPEHLQVAMWVNTYRGEVDWREPMLELYTDPSFSGLTATWCEGCGEDHGTALATDIVRAFDILRALTP